MEELVATENQRRIYQLISVIVVDLVIMNVNILHNLHGDKIFEGDQLCRLIIPLLSKTLNDLAHKIQNRTDENINQTFDKMIQLRLPAGEEKDAKIHTHPMDILQTIIMLCVDMVYNTEYRNIDEVETKSILFMTSKQDLAKTLVACEHVHEALLPDEIAVNIEIAEIDDI